MFGFFKKTAMITALETCQRYHKEIDIGQELTEEQMNAIIQVSSFKDIANIYKSKGMTEWGGLAWFCGEFTSSIFDQINQGVPVKSHVQEMAEKLASISIAIATAVPASKLTFEDAHAIKVAAGIASQWLNNEPFIHDLKQSGL